MNKFFTAVVVAGSALAFISSVRAADYKKTETLHTDDFTAATGDWYAEGGSFSVANGALDINTGGGMTVWFKPKLTGNVMIEYDVTMIAEGGANDNNKDMNCFWMAHDPRHPDDLFAVDRSAGNFPLYDALDLYYGGYGGNNNTTSRFRKYRELDGARNKDIQQEYTDAAHLLSAGTNTYRIRLVQYQGSVEYWRNGEKIWDFADTDPYTSGHFGFRAYQTHYRAAQFRVYRLGAPGDPVTGDTTGIVDTTTTDTTVTDTTVTDTTTDDTTAQAVPGTTSTAGWQNFALGGTISGQFSISCGIVPRTVPCNAVFCLANGDVGVYADGAVLIRFFTDGTVDARDGGTYRADGSLTYVKDTEYRIRLEVDVDAHTYDAYVATDGGSELLLASGYGFRTEQAGVTGIDGWALRDDAGEVVVSDVRTEQHISFVRLQCSPENASVKNPTRSYGIDGRAVYGRAYGVGIRIIAETGQVCPFLRMH